MVLSVQVVLWALSPLRLCCVLLDLLGYIFVHHHDADLSCMAFAVLAQVQVHLGLHVRRLICRIHPL